MGPVTGAEDRKLTFCPSIEGWPISKLVEECPNCHAYLLACCSCRRHQSRELPCHRSRIVFTDGACTNNGRPEAKAGAGIAVYSELGSKDNLAIPITEQEDDFPKRSSQRAELFAARRGLEYLAELQRLNTRGTSEKLDKELWIVATDSEYVVKGMTEWLPKWKKNNWLTAKRTPPVNSGLFLDLDAEVTKHEMRNIEVAFWHIPREYNKVADRLAKAAAA